MCACQPCLPASCREQLLSIYRHMGCTGQYTGDIWTVHCVVVRGQIIAGYRRTRLETQVVGLWVDGPVVGPRRLRRLPFDEMNTHANSQVEQPDTHHAKGSVRGGTIRRCRQPSQSIDNTFFWCASPVSAADQGLLTRRASQNQRGCQTYQIPSQFRLLGLSIFTNPRTRWYQRAVSSTSLQARDM